MKKFLSTLILISFLAILVAPQVATAVITEAPKTCKITRDLSKIDSDCTKDAVVTIEDHGMCCLVNTLYNITDWIFVILVGLAGIFIIIGAMTLMTAAGDPSKVASGRNYIMYAAIGLIVAFLAKAIPNMVKMIGGIGG